jgi:hypothetical protein
MLEQCKKDLSLGLEARCVPIAPPAIKDNADDSSTAAQAAPGTKQPGKKTRDKDLPPYPLFAYCVKSPGNPRARTSVCCQCEGDCRTNPQCACRMRYPGDIPLRPGEPRLTDGQLGYKVELAHSL